MTENNAQDGVTYDPNRYESMKYNRCGRSGLLLPAVSLGCWHNFGGGDDPEEARQMLRRAFDLGITHFDLANNYGPPPGSAEDRVGQLLQEDFAAHRDELIISSKAGYKMWEGPYGNWGSKKYLVSSLDQSLRRLRLEYVDIFYHHRFDPHTPLEETIAALDLAVRQGKALYAGISNYGPEQVRHAQRIARELGTPILINQVRYSMFARDLEEGLLDATEETGMGVIVFSPLAQGLLTDRYLEGVPEDSRAAKEGTFLPRKAVTADRQNLLRNLNALARARGQTLAQMALSWDLRDPRVTSVLIGASKAAQIEDCVGAIEAAEFSPEELEQIESVLNEWE